MHVPETAVYKYYFSAAWKNQIGFAGKIAPVQTEPVTHSMSH